MKSPTTFIAYIRLIAAALLIGHIVFTVFTKGAYFLDVPMSLAYTAVWALIDKLLGAVESHYTADSPPAPKAGTTGKVIGVILIVLSLWGLSGYTSGLVAYSSSAARENSISRLHSRRVVSSPTAPQSPSHLFRQEGLIF